MRRLVLFVVLIGAPATVHAEHVSVFAGFGTGGGTNRQEGFHLMVYADARYWLGEHVGLFATASAHGTPDRETHGTFFGGGVTYRWLFPGRAEWHVQAFEVSAGLGRHRLIGKTIFNAPGGEFDDTNLGWNLRVGTEQIFGDTLIMGGGLAAYGAPGQGVAIVVQFGFGISPH